MKTNLPIDASLLSLHQPIAARDSGNGKDSHPAALRKTCETFEAVFTQQLFKAMRSTVGDGGLLEKGQADAIYNDLMDQQVARDLAASRSLGITDMLFDQLRQSS